MEIGKLENWKISSRSREMMRNFEIITYSCTCVRIHWLLEDHWLTDFNFIIREISGNSSHLQDLSSGDIKFGEIFGKLSSYIWIPVSLNAAELKR